MHAAAFQPDLQRVALVVVDMQNDFVRAGAPLEVPEARATIPVIRDLVERFRRRGRPVVFTRFIAGPKRTLMWNWSPMIAAPEKCCWRNHKRYYADVDRELECAAVIDELPAEPVDYVVDKYGYDAFHNTNLIDILAAEDCNTILLTGTVTHICVHDTAVGAFHHGVRVITVSDAVSSYLPDLHAGTLLNLSRKYGWVKTSAEIVAEMEAAWA